MVSLHYPEPLTRSRSSNGYKNKNPSSGEREKKRRGQQTQFRAHICRAGGESKRVSRPCGTPWPHNYIIYLLNASEHIAARSCKLVNVTLHAPRAQRATS